MPFQFFCPQGHLLEGQESQIGLQGQCPVCGQPFIIPAPAGVVGIAPSPMPAIVSDAALQEPEIPAAALNFGAAPPPFDVQAALNFAGGQSVAAAPGFSPQPPTSSAAPAALPAPAASPAPAAPPVPAAPPPPKVVHIPCPKGHKLETPEEMFGLEAKCPVCSAQFILRLEDSIEFLAEKAERDRLEDEKLSRFWLKTSIWAAVISVVAAISWIVYITTR